jgi:nucleoside 2-deoxyribosyltransferase
MTKRFYLATRRDRADEANAISAALHSHGWERTLTWSAQEGVGPAAHSELAQAELRAVAVADVLIVMLPGGYGTHVEIGAALALGKPVILHAANRKVLETPYPCVFHYHPGIKLLVSESLSIDELLSQLSPCV